MNDDNGVAKWNVAHAGGVWTPQLSVHDANVDFAALAKSDPFVRWPWSYRVGMALVWNGAARALANGRSIHAGRVHGECVDGIVCVSLHWCCGRVCTAHAKCACCQCDHRGRRASR
jgi:hypothetical protein